MFELFDPAAPVHITVGSSLPHWYQPGVSYFVTFRTEDSIPEEVGRKRHAQRTEWLAKRGIKSSDSAWREQLAELPEFERRLYHSTFSQRYLEVLDKGLGACVLRQPELSEIVSNALLHFDGDRYHMGDFVIMPNHVHLIVCLLGTSQVVALCSSWKRFTAREINKTLGSSGRFWQEESFDHLIRSEGQFRAVQNYIRTNPDKLRPGEYRVYQSSSLP